MHYRAAHHHHHQAHNQETDQRLLPFPIPLPAFFTSTMTRSTSGTPTPTTMPDSATPEKTKDKPKEGLSTRFLVLVVLSLQNSLFTVLRRYSQGVLKETYSKYELLLLGEIIKIAFSAYIILQQQDATSSSSSPESGNSAAGGVRHFKYLIEQSGKMVGLAAIYGAMNILSFVSLRNIGAGLFTIFAQTKILTTAVFSTMLLGRAYSSTQWRALVALSLGVLLFSEPVWNAPDNKTDTSDVGNVVVGVGAVLVEVTLSGFASIYFEKVIKTDPLQLNIWERNFQLALGSIPVYLLFILADGGGTAGFLGGWSWMALLVAVLGAAGGLLVALSIKYGDAILKTLATTAAIILSSVIDKFWLGGPLTPVMMIAGAQVIVAICNYTFDSTPLGDQMPKSSERPAHRISALKSDEEIALIERKNMDDSEDDGNDPKRQVR